MLSGWLGFAERTAGGKRKPNKAEQAILDNFSENVMIAYRLAEESLAELARRSTAA